MGTRSLTSLKLARSSMSDWGERRHNRTFVWVDTVGSRTPAIASRRAFVLGSISPDGTRVAAGVEGATAEIWAYDVEHDKPTRLAYGWDNGNPVWTPDNQRILFASTRGRWHTNSVYGQPSDGTGTAERVVGNDSEHVLPCAVSSDGKVLLIIQRGERIQVADSFVFFYRPFGGAVA